MVGWIKLHRSIFDSEVFKSKEPFSEREAWIWLICKANFESKMWRCDYEMVEVKRGELATSQRELSKVFSWSRWKTERYLCLLKSSQMISIRSNTKYSHISIINYDSYQQIDATPQATGSDTPQATSQTRVRHTPATTKEGKELKEGKETKNKEINTLSDKVSPSRLDEFLESVPSELLEPSLIPAIRDWVGYRKEKGDTLTKRSLSAILSKYQGKGRQLVEDVEFSIQKGYTGLYSPYRNGTTSTNDKKQSAVDLINKIRREEYDVKK